jgi:hypothetical protein
MCNASFNDVLSSDKMMTVSWKEIGLAYLRYYRSDPYLSYIFRTHPLGITVEAQVTVTNL